MNKKRVKIKFCDDFGKNFIQEILKESCIIEESEKPDYVVCTPQTLPDALHYNCVRVWITGENVRPDFNLVDYAIGFDDITFADRYLQLPLYAIAYRSQREMALTKHMNIERDYVLNRDFCAWIVSNGAWGAIERTEIYTKLSEYKHIDCGGRYLNNMPDGQPIPRRDSISFYHKHKFVLALENAKMPGYTTEKIVEAWAGQTVPIYWGDPEINNIFNEKAFINANHFHSWEQLKAEVKRIDEDDDEYLKMLREPILLPNSKCHQYLSEDYTKKFLNNIFDKQSAQEALRRGGNSYWVKKTEEDMKEYNSLREKRTLYRLLRKLHIIDASRGDIGD